MPGPARCEQGFVAQRSVQAYPGQAVDSRLRQFHAHLFQSQRQIGSIAQREQLGRVGLDLAHLVEQRAKIDSGVVESTRL